ncbi:MAG: class I SAM-dependent methyltransferase [Bacteroidetes bacterium]|nr:class I SAM-dependent methyltransferase [Bacteroidota bacterium]
MPLTKGNQEIYTHLAVIYDDVMREIDYDDWADYIDAVIQKHHPDAQRMLELACGTGSLALSMEELDCYDITASDFSEHMLEIARTKAQFRGSSIVWKRIDFFDIPDSDTYDVIIMLFDSINYVRDVKSVQQVFEQVKGVLSKDGIFIVDFTTPQHSAKHADLMNDQGITPDNYRFVRISNYLEAEGNHYNEFIIEKLSDDKQTVLERTREVHVQKTFTLAEIRQVAATAGLLEVAAYDDLDLVEATDQSDRITLVLK